MSIPLLFFKNLIIQIIYFFQWTLVFPSCHLKLLLAKTLILYTKTKLFRATSSIYPTYTHIPIHLHTWSYTHFHHLPGGGVVRGWWASLAFRTALALQHASGIQMRIAFVLVLVLILVLVLVLFLVSRHHQRYSVFGSRQSSVDSIRHWQPVL